MEVFKVLGNRWKNLSAIALLVILVTLFYLPLFQGLKTTVPGLDWYGIYPFPSFFRLSVLQYHQFPLRAPYFGGGYPLIGHPYDISLNPLSIIVLLFGAIEGTKITVFLIFLMSAVSVFYLTRYILQYNILGSLFSSLSFAFSSWGSCQYLQSNYEKLYVYFLPLALVFFIKAIKNKKFIFLTCLALSAVVLCGGAMLVPVVLFLFLFASLNTVRIENGHRIEFNFQYLKVFLLTMLITFFLCMVKILPMHSLLSREDVGSIHFPCENNYSQVSKIIIEQERALNPQKLYKMLFVKDFYITGVEGGTGDDYLQFYMGYILVLFAALSFIFYWRATFRYLLLLIIFILLSFGPYSRLDLFKWLWHLHPVIHGIWRMDEYFTFPIVFILSVAAGRIFLLSKKGAYRICLLFLISAAVFSLNNMFWPNRRFLHNEVLKEVPKKMVQVIDEQDRHSLVFQTQFYQVKIKDPLADPEHYQKDGYFYLQQNVGMADWLFTNLKIRSAVIPKYFIGHNEYRYVSNAPEKLELNTRYKGEVFFLNNSNDAWIQYFSPNEIHLSVALKKSDTLVINQNYHRAWRTDTGYLFDRHGLLAIALDKTGNYTVKLIYVPLDFYFGLSISAVAFALSCYFLLYKRRN